MGVAQGYVGCPPSTDDTIERVIRSDEQYKVGIEVIQCSRVEVLVEISGQAAIDEANGVSPFGIVPCADHEAFLHGFNVLLCTIQGCLLIMLV
ncbi:hypothetical protein D3C76_916630 [compost metagenome]